jgi:RNA recognition motif-containing protein
MDSKLYVGNLSYSTTEEGLQAHFSSVGGVKSVAIIKDRDSGRSKGFGFVEMEDANGAATAIQRLNGAALDNRNLTVSLARPKEEGGGGGRGFGGGGGERRGGFGGGDRRGGGGGGDRRDRGSRW